jgi:hypothetical protein
MADACNAVRADAGRSEAKLIARQPTRVTSAPTAMSLNKDRDQKPRSQRLHPSTQRSNGGPQLAE